MSADDTFSRRRLLATGARGFGGALLLSGVSAEPANAAAEDPRSHMGEADSGEVVPAPANPGGNYKPVVAPNGSKLLRTIMPCRHRALTARWASIVPRTPHSPHLKDSV